MGVGSRAAELSNRTEAFAAWSVTVYASSHWFSEFKEFNTAAARASEMLRRLLVMHR